MSTSEERLFVTSVLILIAGVLASCSTNPHKAKKIETEMERSSQLNNERVGVKDGDLVVQKKVEMNEELRRIQNEVHGLEDRVYGNRKYGSKGLYGALKDCRLKLSSKELGGTGKLMWTEPLDRITDKEDEWTVGIDEKDKIVGVSEEFLNDRLTRFRGYKKILIQRQDEYEEKLDICDAAVREKSFDQKKKKKSTISG